MSKASNFTINKNKGTTDLSAFNNGWYAKQIGAPRWKQFVWYFVNVIFFINPLNVSSGLKVKLLRLFGSTIGKGVVIKPNVNIKYPWLLSVGNHSWIGEKVWIDNLAPVTLGDHVCLSQGVLLLTGNHNYKKPTFDLMIGPIQIEQGVWVGAKSVVTPGVKCQSHAVLAVQSVATSDLESYTIYQGNPATPRRKRPIKSSPHFYNHQMKNNEKNLHHHGLP